MTSLFTSPLISTLICVVFVFALLSLLVSNLTEWLNMFLKQRSLMLYKAIYDMFNDRVNVNFGKLLYSHPAIDSLKKNRNSLPQYISDKMFANALIDVIANYSLPFEYNSSNNRIELNRSKLNEDLFERFAASVDRLDHTDTKMVLLNMVEKSRQKGEQSPNARLTLLENEIMFWYNGYMERVTGWYKECIRKRLFWIALLVAFFMNVNAIHLFQSIYRDPQLQAQLLPIAESTADRYQDLAKDTVLTDMQRANLAISEIDASKLRFQKDSGAIRQIDSLIAKIHAADSLLKLQDSTQKALLQRTADQGKLLFSLGLPIGWSRKELPLSLFSDYRRVSDSPLEQAEVAQDRQDYIGGFFMYVLGILISAYTMSLGAPFWFDMLLKLVNMRRAGLKPKKTISTSNEN